MMFPRLSMVRRFPFDNGCPRPEVSTRAVLQLTHGISEHSGRYDHLHALSRQKRLPGLCMRSEGLRAFRPTVGVDLQH
jgi:hypothetical protein